MQIDNLHERSNPVFWKNKKKKVINLSSAKLAWGMEVVNFVLFLFNPQNHCYTAEATGPFSPLILVIYIV